MKRAFAAAVGVLLAAAPASLARAAPPTGVSVTARPLFGPDASAGDGWVEIVARVDNATGAPARGTLTVASDRGSPFSSESHFVARAPFDVPPRSSAVVHVPVALDRGMPSLTCVATTDDGAKLAEATVSTSTGAAPLLLDVDTPSRVAIVMRGWPMSPGWAPGHAYSRGASTALTVGALETDATTGDAVLPVRAAAYAPVTVALFPSDRLARMRGTELSALLGWVLSGGTLAVFPTRPEDLRAGVLTTLAGGAITPAPAPPAMMSLPSVTRSSPPEDLPPPPGTPPWAPAPSGGGGDAATPIGWWLPARTTTTGPSPGLGPSPALAGRLVGFRGGNLHPSDFGASAPYGLGQVHVLGFDPTTPPALEDGWTHARLLEMISGAWDRRAIVAFPQGAGNERASSPFVLHRALDPNESFRPALAVAAVLLVLYSIVAGPLLFLRARRRGRPMDPLLWVPVASAACFALVVLVGRVGKGWSGRARHLSLLESGAGMSRGTIRRFRSFFASETRALRVHALEPGGVLDLMSADSHDLQEPVLRLDETGASLENLTSLPWQTVVVSEDAFGDLGAGVTVHQARDGEVTVANRSGRTLRNVVVWAPKSGATFFSSVAEGARVSSRAGRDLFVPSGRTTTSAGSRSVHALETSAFTALGGKAADEMVGPWAALAAASDSAVDWWPDDVPVVLAELEGGDAAPADTGLRVESDRLMLRVLGEGGAE